ncbi:uncharacterized protein WM277_015879 [Molossus nigricans]
MSGQLWMEGRAAGQAAGRTAGREGPGQGRTGAGSRQVLPGGLAGAPRRVLNPLFGTCGRKPRKETRLGDSASPQRPRPRPPDVRGAQVPTRLPAGSPLGSGPGSLFRVRVAVWGRVWIRIGIGVGLWVRVRVRIRVGVGVGLWVRVRVRIRVGVGVGLWVRVRVRIRVGVGVRVQVRVLVRGRRGERDPSRVSVWGNPAGPRLLGALPGRGWGGRRPGSGLADAPAPPPPRPAPPPGLARRRGPRGWQRPAGPRSPVGGRTAPGSPVRGSRRPGVAPALEVLQGRASRRRSLGPTPKPIVACGREGANPTGWALSFSQTTSPLTRPPAPRSPLALEALGAQRWRGEPMSCQQGSGQRTG